MEGMLKKLGTAAQVMSQSQRYRRYPIAYLSARLEPPIQLGQIIFFYDRNGSAVGYLTWAFLDIDTEKRYIHNPGLILHISEWNEGDRLWFMDIVVNDSRLRKHISKAYTKFPGHTDAKSLRRKEDGGVKKIVHWRR